MGGNMSNYALITYLNKNLFIRYLILDLSLLAGIMILIAWIYILYLKSHKGVTYK